MFSGWFSISPTKSWSLFAGGSEDSSVSSMGLTAIEVGEREGGEQVLTTRKVDIFSKPLLVIIQRLYPVYHASGLEIVEIITESWLRVGWILRLELAQHLHCPVQSF